ncbi:PUB domain [Trinorchestia longiramus]|nr:PUB domain [Trinorchestia longiramus]
MEESLTQLRSEASTKDLRTAIETLIQILRNIHQNSTNDKFRKIRTTNAKIVEKFWRFEGARTFLLITGWRCEGEHIVLDSDVDVVDALNFLVENRFVRPSEQEWVAETKQIIVNPEKERDLQLRAEAMKKKQREMEELMKDMDERKEIAANIIAEHRNDMEKRKIHRRVGQTETPGSPSTALVVSKPRPVASPATHRLASLPPAQASSSYHI